MPREEKPLPIPPKAPFGLRRRFKEDEEGTPLLTDRMAAAMAEGKLEEFLESEFPDNEHVRALASLVQVMTGMVPTEGVSAKPEKAEAEPRERGTSKDRAEPPPDSIPPDDILKAAETGNVQGLMESLEREHKKRVPAEESTATENNARQEQGSPVIERETIDQLVKIASDNNLSLDWLILRALKLYVRDYAASGRL